MRSYIFLFLGIFVMICISCSEDMLSQVDGEREQIHKVESIEILRFETKEELQEMLISLKNKSRSSEGLLQYGLTTTRVRDLSMLNGSPLLLDMNNLDRTEDLTLYKAAGFDTLVPEIEVAQLLNVNGQIQIGDSIYKISSKGTYVYHVSRSDYFIEHFDTLENNSGTLINDNLYQLSGDIKRYATFDNREDMFLELDKFIQGDLSITDDSDPIIGDLPEDGEENLLPNEGKQGWDFSNEIDWSQLPLYNTEDISGLDKLWQTLFGCDRGYFYRVSDKRRVKVKLYYYNYIFWASTGAYVVLQKKNWIGWSGTETSKIMLKWNNIVFRSVYSNKPNENMYKENQPAYIGTIYDVIPGFTYKGYISSYVGIKLTNEQLERLKTLSAKLIFSWLQNQFGVAPPSHTNVIMLYANDEVITIIPDGWRSGFNKEKVEVNFAKSWGFTISVDFLNLPASWYEFALCINGSTLNYPELVSANIKGAAYLNDGTWGGVRLCKN